MSAQGRSRSRGWRRPAPAVNLTSPSAYLSCGSGSRSRVVSGRSVWDSSSMSVTLMLAADLVHVGGGLGERLGFFLGAAGRIGSHAAVAVKQVRIRSRRRCSWRAESDLRRVAAAASPAGLRRTLIAARTAPLRRGTRVSPIGVARRVLHPEGDIARARGTVPLADVGQRVIECGKCWALPKKQFVVRMCRGWLCRQ